MYSNHQNASRAAPGRKKRRETFTGKQTAIPQNGRTPSAGRNSRKSTSPGRRRNVVSPGPGRASIVSPAGTRRRTSSVPERTPPSKPNSPPQRTPMASRTSTFQATTTASPGRRRKPRVSPAASAAFHNSRSEEFKPRSSYTSTTTTRTTTTTTPVCKPTAKPRQSRLAGFSLTCRVEGCDGGANCLHM